MAKRSVDEWDSQRVEVVLVNKQEEPPKTVRLRLLRNLKLNITGLHTGVIYHFNGGGAELDVDYNDGQIMLQKMSGTCDCPGSSGGYKPYFEIVK